MSFDISDVPGILSFWRLHLYESNYDVILKTGINHPAEKPLSKRKAEGGNSANINGDIPVAVIDTTRDTNKEIKA